MSDPRTLGPWLRRFLTEYIVTGRNLARNTQKSCRDTFALFLPFVGAKARKPVDRLTVQDLTARRVRQFLDHLEEDRGCSAQTRNQRLTGDLYSEDRLEEGNAAADRLARQGRDEGVARGSEPPDAEGPDRTRPPPVPL